MSTTTALLLAAVVAQGAIALVLAWMLGVVRVPLVTSGEISVAKVALSREAWPEQEKKVSNAFDNQFQLPVLFYVACGVALYFGAGWLEVVLAWLFVVSRIVHAVIFVTRNRVYRRFFAYSFGFFVVVVLWIDLAVRLVFVATRSA
jgi:hypothetical protein